MTDFWPNLSIYLFIFIYARKPLVTDAKKNPTIIQRENWALTLLSLFEVFPDFGFIFSLCNLYFLCYGIYLSQLQMHLSLYLLIVPQLPKYRKTMKNPELRTKNHLCCMEKYYVTSSKHEIFGQTFSIAIYITSLYLSKVLAIEGFLTNL